MSPAPSRRSLLHGSGAALLAAVTGCVDVFGGPGGVTYVLEVEQTPRRVPDDHVFDPAELSAAEREILETAIETGSYRQERANWEPAPHRTAVSDAFKSVIRSFCEWTRADACHSRNQTPYIAYFTYESMTYKGTLRVESSGP